MTSTPDPFAAPHQPDSGARPGETGTQAVASQAAPPAAWYADPTQPNSVRYWDGAAWTEHTAPAPTGTAQIQPTFATFDTGVDADAAAARSRRRRRFATVGGVVGSLVVVLGVRLIGIGGFDAVTAFFNSHNPEALTAEPGADWQRVDVLEGHGTVTYDPSWQAADVELGEVPAEGLDALGPDLYTDAAWIIDTDADGNQSILYVYSARGLSGVVQPELEVDAMIDNSFTEKTNTSTVSESAIVTSADIRGFVSEFEYDYYGWHFIDSAAVVVHGPDEVLLYVASGSEAMGSGVEELEAVLNSLVID